MRLKHKITYEKKRPTPGDIRVIKKFALFPTLLSDSKTSKIWLEPYWVIQLYVKGGEYRSHGRSIYWADKYYWRDEFSSSGRWISTITAGRKLVEERRRVKADLKKSDL